MHVLKPEAINITRKKYTECTYKHKNYLYIYLYIYIYIYIEDPFQKNGGDNYAQARAPSSERAKTTQHKVEEAREMKEDEIRTKDERGKKAESDGVHGKNTALVWNAAALRVPCVVWDQEV